MYGKLEIVRTMIDKGADKEAKTNVRNVIMMKTMVIIIMVVTMMIMMMMMMMMMMMIEMIVVNDYGRYMC